MGKREKIVLKILFVFIILSAIIHTSLSLFIEDDIKDISKGSITGKISFDIQGNVIQLSPIQKGALVFEWGAVIVIIILILLKGKMELDKEMKASKDILKNKESIQTRRGKSETDLDLLYKLLKEKKILRISVIAEIFKIDKDMALEWCKILEEGNLATINYPTIGDPRVIINEEKEVENEKKE